MSFDEDEAARGISKARSDELWAKLNGGPDADWQDDQIADTFDRIMGQYGDPAFPNMMPTGFEVGINPEVRPRLLQEVRLMAENFDKAPDLHLLAILLAAAQMRPDKAIKMLMALDPEQSFDVLKALGLDMKVVEDDE